MPRLVVEDYGLPQARWELELAPSGGADGEASPSSSSFAPPRADGAAPSAAATMTVREAKARFTRDVFGAADPDAWVS